MYDMSPEALTSLHDDILLEWSCMAQDCLEPRPGRFVSKVMTLLRVAESLKDIEQSLGRNILFIGRHCDFR